MPRAKILLSPVKREDLELYTGHVLYRTSGPVTILSVKERCIEYRLEETDTIQQNYKGLGFFKPVYFIVEKEWDTEDRFVEALPEEHFDLFTHLLQLDNGLLAIGLNPLLCPIV